MGRTNRDMVMVSFYLDRADKLALDTLAAVWGCSKGEAYRRSNRIGLEAVKADPARFEVPSAVTGGISGDGVALTHESPIPPREEFSRND